MLTYVVVWLVCAAALAVAVGGLTLTYRLSDTDFGTSGLRRETVIVLIVSALQAATFLGVNALLGYESRWASRSSAAIIIVLMYVTYKLSHLEEMDEQEIGLLILTDLGIVLLVSLYIQL